MTALILHGGAGARRERNYDAEVVHMREVVEAMKARLDAGASAVDVAVEAVILLEDSGLYVAGRGASRDLSHPRAGTWTHAARRAVSSSRPRTDAQIWTRSPAGHLDAVCMGA